MDNISDGVYNWSYILDIVKSDELASKYYFIGDIVNKSILSTLIAFSVVIILCLITIYKSKDLRTNFNILLSMMMLGDFLVCSIHVPLAMYRVVTLKGLPYAVCTIPLLPFVVVTNLVLIAEMALVRAWVVMFPFKRVPSKVFYIGIAVAVMFGIAHAYLYVVSTATNNQSMMMKCMGKYVVLSSINLSAMVKLLFAVVAAVLVTVSVSYVTVSVTLWRKSRSSIHGNSTATRNNVMLTVRSAGLILLCYILSYLPSFMAMMLAVRGVIPRLVSVALDEVGGSFVYSHSLVAPLVYAANSRVFRSQFAALWFKPCRAIRRSQPE